MRFLTLLVMVFCLFTLTLSFGETERPLEKSEGLITALKFYDALLALEPLLTIDEKSEDQEKALWLANMLSDRLQRELTDEYREYYQEHKGRGFIRGDLSKEWGKVDILNRLGARFAYFEIGGAFLYHYGFLKRLVELYPDSEWRPAAEYYLIQEGAPAPRDAQKTLKALYAYVKKYQKSGLTEIYMAYLEIARINHGLWAFLAHPNDDPFGAAAEYTSGDSEKDKKLAKTHKAEALKYYAKFILSRFQGKYAGQRKHVLESYKELKQNKATGYDILVID